MDSPTVGITRPVIVLVFVIVAVVVCVNTPVTAEVTFDVSVTTEVAAAWVVIVRVDTAVLLLLAMSLAVVFPGSKE